MNGIIERLTGLDKLSDQVIATDFLISAKTGIRNYAAALTETTSPELRIVLKNHLHEAIRTHEAITNFMIKNGFYHAYNPSEQFVVDRKVTDTALGLARGYQGIL